MKSLHGKCTFLIKNAKMLWERQANVDLRSTWLTIVYVDLTMNTMSQVGRGWENRGPMSTLRSTWPTIVYVDLSIVCNEPSGKGLEEPWANVDLRSTWPTIVYIN